MRVRIIVLHRISEVLVFVLPLLRLSKLLLLDCIHKLTVNLQMNPNGQSLSLCHAFLRLFHFDDPLSSVRLISLWLIACVMLLHDVRYNISYHDTVCERKFRLLLTAT